MVCQYGITDNSKPYIDTKQGVSLIHSLTHSLTVQYKWLIRQ